MVGDQQQGAPLLDPSENRFDLGLFECGIAPFPFRTEWEIGSCRVGRSASSPGFSERAAPSAALRS
jgi:hypothetical protein